MAERMPAVRFRSGNAEGTDTAFAEGVAAVAPDRMEYVMPHAGMGRRRRIEGCRVITLADLPNAAEEVLADITCQATRSTGGLIEAYRTRRTSALGAKGAYLMRDTLKVVGHPESGLAPATAGLFFVNEDDPLAGGTGHTIRVCMEYNVPVVTAIWEISEANVRLSRPKDSARIHAAFLDDEKEASLNSPNSSGHRGQPACRRAHPTLP